MEWSNSWPTARPRLLQPTPYPTHATQTHLTQPHHLFENRFDPFHYFRLTSPPRFRRCRPYKWGPSAGVVVLRRTLIGAAWRRVASRGVAWRRVAWRGGAGGSGPSASGGASIASALGNFQIARLSPHVLAMRWPALESPPLCCLSWDAGRNAPPIKGNHFVRSAPDE